MAFPNSLLSQSTWRLVGLGHTATVFALGTWCLVAPVSAAKPLGVDATIQDAHEVNQKGMTFLGVRDVAVASTLFWFGFNGKPKEMGVLMSSWVLVCVVDTWVAAKGPNGWDKGIGTLCVGAAFTAFVAAGLVQSPYLLPCVQRLCESHETQNMKAFPDTGCIIVQKSVSETPVAHTSFRNFSMILTDPKER